MNRVSKKRIINVALCLLLLTPLRACFILLAPVIVIWISKVFKLRLYTYHTAIMIFLFFVSIVWGIIMGSTTIKNIILSAWIVLPIFAMICCDSKKLDAEWAKDFLLIATRVVVIVDMLGVAIGLIKGFHPDFMAESYGFHFARMNGLAILNVVLLVYQFCVFKIKRSNSERIYNNVIYILILFLGLILCNSGLALICMAFSFVLIFLSRFSVKSLFYVLMSLLVIISLIKKYGTDYDYYVRSATIVVDNSLWENDARKVMAFVNYANIVKDYPADLLWGCGPGGYNSRTAFLINNDGNNPFTYLMGHAMPLFHLKYIYPLWNSSLVSIDEFNDGSRNKPFSSCLSVLSEYGIIMFLLIFSFFFKIWCKYIKVRWGTYRFSVLFDSIFIFLMLLFDQWIETSEMVFVLLVIMMQGSFIINDNIKYVHKKNNINPQIIMG